MRTIAALVLAVGLAGCGSKSAVQQWPESQPAMPAHAGPVCLLPAELPEGVKSTFLGRAVANQQWYGGYAGVNAALASVARSSGADVVSEKRQRMKIGMFAWARPQVWGYAHRLADPASINCDELGGTVYFGSVAASAPTVAPSAATYDQCMARVMRISDQSLRLQAMPACDGAK